MNISYTARSANKKTGDVPTAWVGRTEEEALASCAGCSLAPKAVGGQGGCYAWSGAVRFGAISARKAAAKLPERYTLAAAIKGAARSARMLRLTGIGDIGRSGVAIADSVASEARAAGLALVGYTHHWREAGVKAAWRGRLMASTETLADADRAVNEGWRATVIVPADAPRTSSTPGGRKVVVCPAQASDRGVTCNTCRLCDASKPGPVIAFRAHGNQAASAAGTASESRSAARKAAGTRALRATIEAQ